MKTVIAKLTGICIALMVICLILAGQSFARIDRSSIVGVWLFDEGSGKIAGSYAGKGDNGELMKGPQWVDGKFGKALKFDGKDDYVEISLPEVLSDIPSNDFTISFWTNVQDISGSGTVWTRLMEAKYDNNNYLQFNIQIDDGKLGINVIDAGIERTFVVDSPISADTWYHVAGVWNASEDKVELYLDGVLQSTEGEKPAEPGPKKMLCLGRRTDGSALTYFDGTIDELGVFDVALTEDDIQSIMTEGLKSFAVIFPAGKLTTTWAEIKK